MYALGDRVWLSTRNLPLCLPCRKMGPRFVGPFKVLRRVNKVCYSLQLPPDYRINSSFHVSLLRPLVAGPLQEAEVREVPLPPLDIACYSSYPGLEASGEGPSVSRGVVGVQSGGDAGCRWRTYWTFRCCEISTVSIRIALRLVLRVVLEAGVGGGRGAPGRGGGGGGPPPRGGVGGGGEKTRGERKKTGRAAEGGW